MNIRLHRLSRRAGDPVIQRPVLQRGALLVVLQPTVNLTQGDLIRHVAPFRLPADQAWTHSTDIDEHWYVVEVLSVIVDAW